MELLWNAEKNEQLKLDRGVSFDDAAAEILAGRVLSNVPHPSRPNQRVFVLRLKGYVCAVPYVMHGETIFLKTIYQSRKLNTGHGVNDGKGSTAR